MTLNNLLQYLHWFRKPSRTKTKDGEDANKKLFSFVDRNCVGRDLVFCGPYGPISVTYCDYTASGRALHFIEEYIFKEVLPHYGNTHTTTSVTSLQTTQFREQAREIIRTAVNAGKDDAVLFVSSGVTGAINKLIHVMDFKCPPVVFVGPYEHHSNLLPWKEIGAEVVWTQEDKIGRVDVKFLEKNLINYKNSNRVLIGSFSAASNITGILTDVDAIAKVLHKYGAVAFFDYATAAPYVNIDMNPRNEREAAKDAIFISTHKFVGGPGTPGLLIAKKNLFESLIPSQPGGGTVIFVTESSQAYNQNIETREEGGTPSIIESIRAGMVFQLKEALKAEEIMKREHKLVTDAYAFWKDIPNIVILGNKEAVRLPIFSIVFYHKESGMMLHHNFVCAILNDVFGIQARGGCACAGPYAENLLGMDEDVALRYSNILVKEKTTVDELIDLEESCEVSNDGKCSSGDSESPSEILKPGFARLNLPFFLSDDGVRYVLAAVKMVAEKGWKFLLQYNYNKATGEWRHRNDQVMKHRKTMGQIKYTKNGMTYPKDKVSKSKVLSYKQRLKNAKRIFMEAGFEKHLKDYEKQVAARDRNDENISSLFDEEEEKLRWFLLPSEAASFFNGNRRQSCIPNPPFTPRTTIKRLATIRLIKGSISPITGQE
ncbi:probable cysteine desulfurase isoform X2 [Rhopilema esculentum]|uniref:probable cysteine desulfurase isoform X2 n=1 Tax=Rhopilema esculentum TaxID=499914 RepID=UPI0031D11EBD